MTTTPALAHCSLPELIRRYQDGDSDAAEELLRRFAPYVGKWVRLLSSGRWSGDDWEVRSFLAMLGCVDRHQTAQILCARLRAYEREDLLQECRLALLETVLKYSTVVRHFRYVLRNRLVVMLRDPLVAQYPEVLAPLPEQTAPLTVEELDELWVQGLTCRPEFEVLSPRQRRLLQLRFAHRLTLRECAERLEVSVSTIKRELVRIKQTLRRAAAVEE